MAYSGLHFPSGQKKLVTFFSRLSKFFFVLAQKRAPCPSWAPMRCMVCIRGCYAIAAKLTYGHCITHVRLELYIHSPTYLHNYVLAVCGCVLVGSHPDIGFTPRRSGAQPVALNGHCTATRLAPIIGALELAQMDDNDNEEIRDAKHISNVKNITKKPIA